MNSHVDNTKNTQSVLSLCPGILGLERGIERGIRTFAADRDISIRGGKAINVVAYVEIEAFIIANLVGQMETGLLDPAPIWTNVKTFDARPFRNKVHGIIGGYPCQPFSHAGERRGVEDERHLYPYISKQIEVIRPEWVYFENVAGHLSMGYDEVRRDLSNLGYRVEEGIFTAEEIGAPHRRERLFIFGVMENAGILGWGGRGNASTQRKECSIQTERSGATLDNSNIECEHRGACAGGRRIAKHSAPSRNVENAYRHRMVRKQQRKLFRNHNRTNTKLDNPFQSRLEGHPGHEVGARRRSEQERSATETSLFPAGQGTFQYEWEEPRTIESSMVYTIDGYNFTEDLHRAIGNSVVEQTAELAFITLLNKHLKY